jgi:hypothetical protein
MQISNNKFTFITRRPIRIVAVHDEEWAESGSVGTPAASLESWQNQRSTADIFTFAEPLPENQVRHPYRVEWDNVAVAQPAAGFDTWWESLPQETRKNVRRAQRRGVTVRQVPLDDLLVLGISRIYNETPIRQGRKFPHYQKSIDRVKVENGTYPDRSVFIGAFHEDSLIGFIKLVRVNNFARIMQIVCLNAHTDKRPTNALLAKAMEFCCEKKFSHLVYGKFVYGTKENSPVTEFKRRNGFERFNFPRYYVPLTTVGRLAIACGLHRGVKAMIPEHIMNYFLASRAALYRRRFARSNPEPVAATAPAVLPARS